MDKQKEAKMDEKEYKLKYSVRYERIDQKSKLAHGKLRKPSALPERYDMREEGDPTPVVFYVLDSNKENEWCLTMMRNLHHRNILHARTVMIYTPPDKAKGGIVSDSDSKEEKLFAWVEPYSGFLIDHLRSIQLGSPDTLVGNTIMLPTNAIRNIMRQIVAGIEHLRICGYCHGNFSLETTFYFMDEVSKKLTVKLTNFKKDKSKMKPLSTLQIEDWHAVGHGLKRISKIASELNDESGYKLFDCCQLDDLAEMMLQLTPGDLETTYQNVLDHIFFWEKLERKQFFVYRIPLALKDTDFIAKLRKCNDLCCIPWSGIGDFAGIIQKMDQFRSDSEEDAYDKFSNLGFVQCTSGMYSHEFLLKEKVDDIIQKFHPQLCWKLFSMLPIPTPDKRWL